MSTIKMFGKWDTIDIHVNDPGLQKYISLDPILVPKSSGRNAKFRFYKSKNNIVERLANKLMIPGHKGKKHTKTSGRCTGKAQTTNKIILETFSMLEKNLQKNPIAVFIKAVENAAPREEITTIEYGGAKYPQAVDCAPQRRVDIALRQMIQGAYTKSFGKKISMARALAEEITKAYNMDHQSQSISKKLELERQADSSR